jgi:hypothetical protein
MFFRQAVFSVCLFSCSQNEHAFSDGMLAWVLTIYLIRYIMHLVRDKRGEEI